MNLRTTAFAGLTAGLTVTLLLSVLSGAGEPVARDRSNEFRVDDATLSVWRTETGTVRPDNGDPGAARAQPHVSTRRSDWSHDRADAQRTVAPVEEPRPEARLEPHIQWIADSLAIYDPSINTDATFDLDQLPFDHAVKQSLLAIASADATARQALAKEILENPGHPAYLQAVFALTECNPAEGRRTVIELAGTAADEQTQHLAGRALSMLAQRSAVSDADLRAFLATDKLLLRRAAAAVLRDRGDDSAWKEFLAANPSERARWEHQQSLSGSD